MSLTTIIEDFDRPGTGAPELTVTIRLVSAADGSNLAEAYWQDDGGTWHTIVSRRDLVIDATGSPITNDGYTIDDGGYTIDLPPNSEIQPAGTRWKRTVTLDGVSSSITMNVPVSGTALFPFNLADDTPAAIDQSALAAHAAGQGPTLHVPALAAGGADANKTLQANGAGDDVAWVQIGGSGVTVQELRDLTPPVIFEDPDGTGIQSLTGETRFGDTASTRIGENVGGIAAHYFPQGLVYETDNLAGVPTTRMTMGSDADDITTDFTGTLSENGSPVITEDDEPVLRSVPEVPLVESDQVVTLSDATHNGRFVDCDFNGDITVVIDTATYRDGFSCSLYCSGTSLEVDASNITLAGNGPNLKIAQNQGIEIIYGDSATNDRWYVIGGTEAGAAQP